MADPERQMGMAFRESCVEFRLGGRVGSLENTCVYGVMGFYKGFRLSGLTELSVSMRTVYYDIGTTWGKRKTVLGQREDSSPQAKVRNLKKPLVLVP